LAAFHGTFEHSLDTKNRLTVPARFRALLAGKVILVRGVEPCISVYPDATYSDITRAALEGLNPFSPQVRELKRMFYGGASDTELDSAGRVMLTPKHLEHAGIDREVVVTGAGDCLELWARSAWEDYDRDLTHRASDLTASLGHPA
jgi:MraZ protein